jgi:hypothetical protein
MRITLVVVLALASGACSFLDQLQLYGPPRLDPNKVYLNRADFVRVGPRETQRFACVNGPLICNQRGIEFECSCP